MCHAVKMKFFVPICKLDQGNDMEKFPLKGTSSLSNFSHNTAVSSAVLGTTYNSVSAAQVTSVI